MAGLAAKLGFPVLADPLSQVRAGSHNRDLVIANYDAFLRDSRFTSGHDFEPEVIVRFGAMPTAKPLLLFLKRFPNLPQYLIDGGDGWNELYVPSSTSLYRFATKVAGRREPYMR